MAKRVFKYIVNLNDAHIAMPYDAKIISAGQQGSDIVVWAEVDSYWVDLGEVQARNVVAIPPGFAEVPESYTFIDTVQCTNGIVLHVYAENTYED